MVQVTAAQATSDDQEPEQLRDRRARRASELRTEETALERAETSHLFRLRRTVRGPHHALVVCAAGASLSTLWRRHLRPSAALARVRRLPALYRTSSLSFVLFCSPCFSWLIDVAIETA
eukprot:scaffold2208_cov237-Pinguiococcus_pyrenoidosus.AAC.1